MAYFNHAFRKTFIMSDYVAPVDPTPGPASKSSGELTSGELSLYDAKTWAPLDVTGTATNSKCQFVIASGAPYANDKVGPFHGGYKESIKSKGINPKFVTKMWEAEANVAQQSILHIGKTPYTSVEATADCCPSFLCGENYHLRVDVKGSPALRMLNHQAYQEITAYTGCCADDTIAPVAVNPAVVMLSWAEQIAESVILAGHGPNGSNNPAPFIIPVVTLTEAGDAGVVTNGTILVYPKGTPTTVLTAAKTATDAYLTAAGVAIVAGVTVVAADDAAVATYLATAYSDQCAGLTLVGAYEETKFGDCTFQPSDFYETEPLRLYASEVDLNGDPCEFTGICILHECEGRKPQGLGETVARDFILSESYRQVPFATDLRIREITQGNDMLGTDAAGLDGKVNRNLLYDRLFILHSIPRYNNPSGTFDNDQYLLEIAAPSTVAGKADIAALKADIEDVLTAAGNADCIEQLAEAGQPCGDPSVVVTA